MPVPQIKQSSGLSGQPTPPPPRDDVNPSLVVLGLALLGIGLTLGYQAVDMLNNHGSLSDVAAVIVAIFFVVAAGFLIGGIVVLAVQGRKWRGRGS